MQSLLILLMPSYGFNALLYVTAFAGTTGDGGVIASRKELVLRYEFAQSMHCAQSSGCILCANTNAL